MRLVGRHAKAWQVGMELPDHLSFTDRYSWVLLQARQLTNRVAESDAAPSRRL